MKPEVNKLYATRDGKRVIKIERIEQKVSSKDLDYHGIAVHGMELNSFWTKDGMFYSNGSPNENELVSEYIPGLIDFDLDKCTKDYALAFRFTPIEDYRYENFDDPQLIHREYKKLLRKTSSFHIFKKNSEGKYETFITKESMTEDIVNKIYALIIKDKSPGQIYLALKNASKVVEVNDDKSSHAN